MSMAGPGAPMRIAVTGATGFLGSALCRQAIAAGHAVVAGLGTDAFRGAVLESEGIPFVPARLSDVDAMARAFAGPDVVVHCAAKSAAWGTRREFEEANVTGTANVVAACRKAGVRRLVHISSTSVYFELSDRLGIREDAPLPRPINEYARSKALAETEALGFEGEVVVLRPRGIFGPGDTTLVPHLSRAARGGRLALLRGGTALVDISHVDVVVSAILAAAGGAEARGTYNVSHGEPIRVRDLVETIMPALRMPFAWRPMPLPVALAAARLSEGLASLPWSGREPRLTAYAVGLMAYSHTLDISAIRRDLGWTPPLTLAEGLRQTVEWLESNR